MNSLTPPEKLSKMNHMRSNSKANTTAFFPRISQLTTTAVLVATLRSIALITVVGLTGLSVTGQAQLTPEWISRVPVGTSFSSGTAGIQVDQDGVSYITGTSGASNADITTVSFAPDGSTRWTQTWGSPGNGADQASGITKGSNGVLYVVGNTPGPNDFANLLILAYDAATGALLNMIQYSSGPGISEFGSSIVTDEAGNIYVEGGTVGDGLDTMTLKFNVDGALQWRRVWDGPAFGPFSQDSPVKILRDPQGNVLVAITGYAADNHANYVVVKYAANDGRTLWEKSWGVNGDDFPADMEIDAAGDIYVTGIGLDFIDKYSTIKLRRNDGQLLWQFYDALGQHHSAHGLFLDGVGGVFITGTSDPDGDESNFNDDFFTVKRDATTGALLWTHAYGDPCVHPGCLDVPSDVRVDPEGHVFVVGGTSSPPYVNDVILFVLDTATGLETNRGLIFNVGSEIPSTGALRFDAAFNLYVGGGINNADTGAKDMTVTKWASLIGGGGGIPCEDLISFQARCQSGGGGQKLQAQLILTNTSHSGEQVTITVDGNPTPVTINGNKAQLSINNPAPGEHTIELTDPAGCFPPRMPSCN
jgi:PQQ-like domain